MEFQSTTKRHPLGARRFNPTARVRDARKLISIHQPAGDAHAHHISIHRSPLLLHHRRRISIHCKMNHPRMQLISIRTRIRGSWRSRKTGFNPLRRPCQTWLGDGRFNPHAQYFSDSGRAVSILAPLEKSTDASTFLRASCTRTFQSADVKPDSRRSLISIRSTRSPWSSRRFNPHAARVSRIQPSSPARSFNPLRDLRRRDRRELVLSIRSMLDFHLLDVQVIGVGRLIFGEKIIR